MLWWFHGTFFPVFASMYIRWKSSLFIYVVQHEERAEGGAYGVNSDASTHPFYLHSFYTIRQSQIMTSGSTKDASIRFSSVQWALQLNWAKCIIVTAHFKICQAPSIYSQLFHQSKRRVHHMRHEVVLIKHFSCFKSSLFHTLSSLHPIYLIACVIIESQKLSTN